MTGSERPAQETIERLRARIESLEWQLREQRRRELQARAEGRGALDAVLASWSWRVTAPLRFVHRLVTRWLGGAG